VTSLSLNDDETDECVFDDYAQFYEGRRKKGVSGGRTGAPGLEGEQVEWER
jgi:hypothetical protein